MLTMPIRVSPALTLILLGCSSSTGIELPDGEPLMGVITKTRAAEDYVDVWANMDHVQEVWILQVPDDKVYAREAGKLREANIEDLGTGRIVEAWTSGVVIRTLPGTIHCRGVVVNLPGTGPPSG